MTGTDDAGPPVRTAGPPPTPGPPPPAGPAAVVAPPAPLFGAGWPGPSTRPSLLVLAAAATVGVTAAVAVPPGRPGVGLLVTALIVTGVLLAVARHDRKPLPSRRAGAARVAWTVVAVGLAGVAALRDAAWLVELCLLAAFGTGSIAVAGRSFRNTVLSALAVPVAALRGLPWVARGVGTTGRHSARLAVSMLVGVTLLVVFGALLTSADAAFATVVSVLVPAVDAPSTVRLLVLFTLGFCGVVGAAFLLAAPPAPAAGPRDGPRRLRTVEWGLPVGLLVLLFGLFVGVQFATLFGSDALVLHTTGLTYAEYARSGFWQLLVVTGLTLGLIVLGSRWAPQGNPVERAWKRGLLGTLALLTLVIVASALSRMWLYQQAYGFTVLRLLVLACELWLGAGFLMLLASVLRLPTTASGGGRPARGLVVTGVLALVSLALLDPERFIAEQNVQRYEMTGRIDTEYLSGLSTDAVPALDRLPQPLRDCALAPIARRFGGAEEDWRSGNASRAAAGNVLARLRTDRTGSGCAEAGRR